MSSTARVFTAVDPASPGRQGVEQVQLRAVDHLAGRSSKRVEVTKRARIRAVTPNRPWRQR
jgi:hypothetical protein